MDLSDLKSRDLREFITSRYGIRFNSGGLGLCPFHNDHEPSLSVYPKGGVWLWKCHAGCGRGSIIDYFAKTEGIGNKEAIQRLQAEFSEDTTEPGPKPDRVHIYRDENGQPVFKKVKYGNSWAWEHFEQGKWVSGKGGHNHIPYNLDKFKDYQTVIVCEGEKDADTVKGLAIGEFATSAPTGCQSWPDDITEHFCHFKKVTFLYDVGNDEHVRKHAKKLHMAFPEMTVTIAHVPSDMPEFDITDYLETQADKPMAFLDVLAREKEIGRADCQSTAEPKSMHVAKALAQPLSSFEKKPTEWLMKDRFPMNMVSALIGDGGVGKSTFLTEVACRVSKNEALPGSDRALVGGAIVYMTTENQPEEVFRPRAEACGGNLDRILYLRDVLESVSEGPAQPQIFNILKHLPSLEALILQRPEIRLVIIDPIISHVGDKLDPNSNLQVRSVIDRLSDLARRSRIAIIVVLHLSKNAGLATIHRAAGSHQWIASVRTAWAIAEDKADPDQHRRFLIPIKSNLATSRKSLAFRILPASVPNLSDPMTPIVTAQVEFDEQEVDINADEFFNLERQAAETKTSVAIRFLNETLKDGPVPEMTVKELATASGISTSTMKYARSRRKIKAEKQGMTGGWHLWLPEHYEALYGNR